MPSDQPHPALRPSLRSRSPRATAWRGHGGGGERLPGRGRGGHRPRTGGGCLTPSQTAVVCALCSSPPSTGRPFSLVRGIYLGSLSPPPPRSEFLEGVRGVSDPGPRPQRAQCPRLPGPAPRGPPARAGLQPLGGSETWLEPRQPQVWRPRQGPWHSGASFTSAGGSAHTGPQFPHPPHGEQGEAATASSLLPGDFGEGSLCLTFPGCAGQVVGVAGSAGQGLRAPPGTVLGSFVTELLASAVSGEGGPSPRQRPAGMGTAGGSRQRAPARLLEGESGARSRERWASCFPSPSAAAPATGWRCQPRPSPAPGVAEPLEGLAGPSDPSQGGLDRRGPGELWIPEWRQGPRGAGVCSGRRGSSALLPAPQHRDPCPARLSVVPVRGALHSTHITPLRICCFQMMHLRLTAGAACPGLTSERRKPWAGSSGEAGYLETLGDT